MGDELAGRTLNALSTSTASTPTMGDELAGRTLAALSAACVALALLFVAQIVAWTPSWQVWLHHSVTGMRILRLLPWQQRDHLAAFFSGYGRATARRPLIRATLAGLAFSLVLGGGGGLLAWPR